MDLDPAATHAANARFRGAQDLKFNFGQGVEVRAEAPPWRS